MGAPANPSSLLPCPLHENIKEDIATIKKKQDNRPCQGHEERIKTVEKSDSEQWTAINELQRTVWKWAGIATAAGCLGSIIGGLLIALLRKV